MNTSSIRGDKATFDTRKAELLADGYAEQGPVRQETINGTVVYIQTFVKDE